MASVEDNITPVEVAVDPAPLLNYIRNLSGIFQADHTESTAIELTTEIERICEQFIRTTTASTLYIVKESKDNGSQYTLLEELNPKGLYLSILAIIKSNEPISNTASFDSQLHILNIPTVAQIQEQNSIENGSNELNNSIARDFSSAYTSRKFELIRSLINWGISPYFELITSDEQSNDSVVVAKKKFNELSLTLQHLQQKIHTPDIISSTHPRIVKLLEDGAEENEDMEKVISKLPSDLLQDTSFLNQLTTIVNSWAKQIKSITRLSHAPSDGFSVIDEILFWKSMDESLNNLNRQLSSKEVTVSLEILKRAKRYHITIGFANEIGLESKLAETNNYNSILKELPLDKLLTSDISTLKSGINGIFNHLKKLRNFLSYPLLRSIDLVDVILKDITKKFIDLVSAHYIMTLPFDDFSKFYEEHVNEIFQVIETNIKSTINLIRELLRKRQEKFIIIRINQDSLIEWKERMEYLKDFRVKHNNLLKTCDILNESHEKLIESYNQYIIPINVCDMSAGGVNIWKSNENLYFKVYQDIKKSAILNINSLFDSCQTFNQFVNLFESLTNDESEKFLLSFISEDHKLRCMSVVEGDIQSMLSNFRKYSFDAVNSLSVYNPHSIVNKVIWLSGAYKSATFYCEKLAQLFGDNWDQYSIGGKISNEINSLKKAANSSDIISEWSKDLQIEFDSQAPIFKAATRGNVNKPEFCLTLNFNYSTLQLVEQLIQLNNLGFKTPSHLLGTVNKFNKISPLVRDLFEHINILNDTLNVELHETVHGVKYGFLFDKLNSEIFSVIEECSQITWGTVSLALELQGIENNDQDLSNLIEYKSLILLKAFLDKVYGLYVKMATVRGFANTFQVELNLLKSCEYSEKGISEKMSQITELVDEFSYEDFASIDKFYSIINDDIEEVLRSKCEMELKNFRTNMTNTNQKFSSRPPVTVSLFYQDLTFSLSPSLSSCKESWINEINAIIGIASNNYQILQNNSKKYIAIFEKISEHILSCYSSVEEVISKADVYLSKWKSLQRLWEVNPEDFEKEFHSESESSLTLVELWIMKVSEMRQARKVFDTTTTEEIIAQSALVINFSSVQLRIAAKYDDWLNSILLRFSNILQAKMQEVDSSLVQVIQVLNQEIDFSLTSKIISSVVSTYTSQKQLEEDWKTSLANFADGQTLLSSMRFKYPVEWIYAEQIENHFIEVSTLASKKVLYIKEHVELIEPRLVNESKRIEDLVQSLKKSWMERRPISGELLPTKAIQILHEFKESSNKIMEEWKNLSSASSFLDIEQNYNPDMDSILEETRDLLNVWLSLDGIWEDIDVLRNQSWKTVSPRVLRRLLDDVLTKSRSLPSTIRQYSAFNSLQDTIKEYIRYHSIVAELKGECMKPRHWAMLFKRVASKGNRITEKEDLTLGNVWDLDLGVNELFIKSILDQAAMEQTLEENLTQIKETWESVSFDTFNYKNNKCRLIKGWDKLFDQCSMHLSSLSDMKNSAFYFNFEQEATTIERRISKLYILLDTWVDVQKEWVYLDGVFGSGESKVNASSEISKLLPLEYSRFNNISHEFFAILRSTNKFPLVIDILTLPDIQKSMERILESLNNVRRSLSDYLESQRDLFPRFYFIGNEDLLQIIGNVNGNGGIITSSINQHFRKMFNGISSINYSEESSTITAVNGELGETINLVSPVSLIKFPRLHEWLKNLELEIKFTLSSLAETAFSKLKALIKVDDAESQLALFTDEFPNQIITLAVQILFTEIIDSSIVSGQISKALVQVQQLLEFSIKRIATNLTPLQRKKGENLIIELLHQRDVLTELAEEKSSSKIQFKWNLQQQFYYDFTIEDPLSRLIMKQSQVEFTYGFEYLGITDKLAYTPLTNRCFLSLTQALGQKLGGSPFGPAGTGKTESVKALGNNIGKMVIVFNCDDTFDFQSMGRIFLGLCRVGCWGCFDEFNRLDENILSAVSSQIERIQVGLTTDNKEIELTNKKLTVHRETGIFITMNPDYAGRSELPENLKKLFRSVSIEKPDVEIIVEVLLTSSGFSMANELAKLIVPLFNDIIRYTSKQIHYDFGLRALKSTLVRCGNIKRTHGTLDGDQVENTFVSESKIVYRSIRETIFPKLIIEDESIVNGFLSKFFPGISYESEDYFLMNKLEEYATKHGLKPTDAWTTKVLQLYRIQKSNHGVMLVGNSGTGKTTIWKLLLHALTNVDEECLTFVIDCKVIQKSDIYGTLDVVTREWVDGLLTGILRRITGNLRGELTKRIWIVFDGDIDPEWAENLNSVLDDNKVLTLPNGERISIPENVKFIFEVDSLKSTTPATVSRCGMVWFDESLVPVTNLFSKLVFNFKNKSALSNTEDEKPDNNIREKFGNHVESKLTSITLSNIITEARKLSHIMDFNIHRYLETLFTLLSTYYTSLYTEFDGEFNIENLDIYSSKSLILALIWTFSGDCPIKERETFGQFIIELECFQEVDRILEINANLIDYRISHPEASWKSWLLDINEINLEPHQVSDSNSVVPTLDTARHEKLIYSMLNEHRPFLLCGPPGSGKTMILLEALKKSPDLDFLSLNFSKDTTPDLLMKSLHQFCEYKKVNSVGWTLAPKVSGKWVVVFCDEINLPGYDKYGTQRVISLLRQMIERGGFWRTQDKQWVTLINIQFVGACNPPTDPGRNRLSERFLRHTSLIMVDYPGKVSLQQIYQTYNLAVMKHAVNLRGFTKSITDSMIEIYTRTKEKLDSSVEQHYVYSPRELTRWSKGLLEGMKFHNYENLDDLIRLWYHEGLRLFYDRLVKNSDREWTLHLFQTVIVEFFPHIDFERCTKAPVLFSNWLSLDYEQVSETNLRSFISERLRVFSEEEINVDLVLYDDMLDHVLRIDRVLRQPQGHMILVGPSTSGKSTLARFVAWINGLKVIQLSVHSGYRLIDFDSTLRSILLRCAAGEKICFMIDESSVLETSFIERMNTLLANAEIPGLFEDDNFVALMKLCQTELQVHGLYLDSEDELYKWFTGQVALNLHVIFTISDTNVENKPKITTSPALFNRCVLSWMGDWSNPTLVDIASYLIGVVPLDLSNYSIPPTFEKISDGEISNLREVIVDTLLYIYRSNISSLPSSFLQLAQNFIAIFVEKLNNLEENQRHINVGLDKLRETVLKVDELRAELSEKKEVLHKKDSEAKIMLNKMLTDQNEAERKQEFSIATQAELSKQQAEIERRRTKVFKDLELAEPAVLEAQRGVQNIKKQHLTEIRSMTNPPNAVKMTMESVCILIGYDVATWRDVQLIVRRDDFVTSIVSFDNEQQLTPDLRNYMEETYLTRSDFTFEAVNRASKACGPLLQWVLAQLSYATILENVGPLREEMRALEESTMKTKAQLIAIDQMINELEESIETYKEDYSQLIRDAENIKSDMKGVSDKVERSLHLVDNLTSERKRWSSSTKRFSIERELLIGNCILASSFATFCGSYSEREREKMIQTWKSRLTSSGIKFDGILSLSTYLTSTKEILDLQNSNSSSTEDNLQNENFAIMKRSHIPLIIDPPADVIETLSKWIASTDKRRKLIVTSFLNSNYIQELENALRFGGIILIQDCEHYDPILNSVLRRETYKNGGRTVIKLRDQEIDFSPDFKLFLHTRDPAISPSQFVLGRSNSINFTVTNLTLQNQILNITLNDKNPEVEFKRKELTLLQGTYKARLYTLEKELLSSLSVENGKNILEDDEVVATLEALKAESNQIDLKMNESSKIMEEVDAVRSKYSTVANHSSSIFKVLQLIKKLNRFYDFALSSFIAIFDSVLLQSKGLSIDELVILLYKETFALISPSLRMQDKVVFALCLTITYHELEDGDRYKETVLLILQAIQDISSHGEAHFKEILKLNLIEDSPGSTVDELCKDYPSNSTIQLLSELLRCVNLNEPSGKTNRLNLAYSACTSFLFTGKEDYSSKYGLRSIIEGTPVGSPIMLVSPDGFDPTFEVQQLASALSMNLSIISMGSKEGVEMANREIDKVFSRGSGWVIVQNVQLSGNDWLIQLEKKLQTKGLQMLNNQVKLFLTCTSSSKSIPSTLINKSSVVMFEDSKGIQTRFMEVYKTVPSHVISSTPLERKYLYFLLSWFHCIVLERLKYIPLSFSTHYDITISDFNAGCFIIEKYLQPFGSTRSNISPDLIPWDSIGYMIANITYGGKINNSQDLSYIVDLSKKLFTLASFNHGFNLISNAHTSKSGTVLVPPEDVTQLTQQGIQEWINREVPIKIPLTWIDLDEEVDELVREDESKTIAGKVYRIMADK